MNRIDLEVMFQHTVEIAKTPFESKDCTHGTCANCSYYAICHANRLLQQLIKHEIDKYNVKGS